MTPDHERPDVLLGPPWQYKFYVNRLRREQDSGADLLTAMARAFDYIATAFDFEAAQGCHRYQVDVAAAALVEGGEE